MSAPQLSLLQLQHIQLVIKGVVGKTTIDSCRVSIQFSDSPLPKAHENFMLDA